MTRGPVRLGGEGQRLRLSLPVTAQLGARTLAGSLRETAQASAVITANITLGVAGNWQPTAKVRLAHDWIDPPHIDILGQRVDLTSRADPRLRVLLRDVERTLPQQLARVDLRRVVETG